MPSPAEGGAEDRGERTRCVSEDAEAPTPGRAGEGRPRRDREGAPVRYQAQVEYDGTEFAGFQVNRQANGPGVLEDALARLGDGVSRRVDGAGRLPTQASTRQDRSSASLYPGRLTAKELGAALGAMPRDVAVRDIRPAPGGFKPPLRGAVPGLPLHRLERAAEPLHERTAFAVRTRSTPPRWRGPGRLSSADTTFGPSEQGTGARSGP